MAEGGKALIIINRTLWFIPTARTAFTKIEIHCNFQIVFTTQNRYDQYGPGFGEDVEYEYEYHYESEYEFENEGSLCVTTMDHAAIQFLITSLIILCGWLVQVLASVKICTERLNMNCAWKCCILTSALMMLGLPVIDGFCIFVLICHGDLDVVQQVSGE